MKLKEKCIYYNPVQEGYYLVLSIGDDYIFGRRGDFVHTSNLENLINQDGPGVVFKVGEALICRDYIRNYRLDEKCLDKFELVKELTDDEFYPMEILIHSRYKLPDVLIDIDKIKDNEEVIDIVRAHQDREKELKSLTKEIKSLEIDLYRLVS